MLIPVFVLRFARTSEQHWKRHWDCPASFPSGSVGGSPSGLLVRLPWFLDHRLKRGVICQNKW
ncbi:hypothetical protein Lo5R7ANS_49 [Mesorhizobium phage vB_MloP_Lo5R7ANS]|uniref:Uncharacterized protein n=1 Tax=Mesorhizobium phage vB_MloP_Lo5R7ANS TaxID=1527771 RepID=A0A076YNW3_9CAUD|nr:hypothetical protein Lo5R7ANS_49 [Mesorhizobium phage vB_MloP_Lo5R7ANS]AIK68519.1 hypothetical protein Lo5R7ANS_49 [Mesorhizobium phage vB_MloP_Lo5R7ANS]